MANAWRAVVVQGAAPAQLRRPGARGRSNACSKSLAVAEPFGRQVGGQLQGGDARAVDGVVLQAEGIVEAAERAAALADDGLLALVQLAADDHERRQLRRRSRATRATTLPVAGRGAAGLRLAVRGPTPPAALPVRPMVPATPWSLEPVCSERRMAKRSASSAICGNSSQMRTPGTRVAMVPNGPRNSSGASGLGSQVSSWAGPPQSQSSSTERAVPPRRRRRLGPQPQQVGQRQAEHGTGADLEDGAARQSLTGARTVPTDQQHVRSSWRPERPIITHTEAPSGQKIAPRPRPPAARGVA